MGDRKPVVSAESFLVELRHYRHDPATSAASMPGERRDIQGDRLSLRLGRKQAILPRDPAGRAGADPMESSDP